MEIDLKELSRLLVCPKCKGKVSIMTPSSLACPKCMLEYQITGDVPIMLIDSAKPIPERKIHDKTG